MLTKRCQLNRVKFPKQPVAETACSISALETFGRSLRYQARSPMKSNVHGRSDSKATAEASPIGHEPAGTSSP